MAVNDPDVGFEEPTLHERRYWRMKHLRVDRYRFAAMVPVLLAEGLLPEHVKHADSPDGTCYRCQKTIGEQWKRNISLLRADEAEYMEARWLWRESKEEMITICMRDYKQTVTTTTTKRKRVQPDVGVVWPIVFVDENGEEREEMVPSSKIAGLAFVVETVERVETRIHPHLLELASTMHNELARLAGLDIDEADEDREPTEQGKRPFLVLKPPPERSGGAGGRGRRQPVN